MGNALVSINGVAPGLSATRKLSRNVSALSEARFQEKSAREHSAPARLR